MASGRLKQNHWENSLSNSVPSTLSVTATINLYHNHQCGSWCYGGVLSCNFTCLCNCLFPNLWIGTFSTSDRFFFVQCRTCQTIKQWDAVNIKESKMINYKYLIYWPLLKIYFYSSIEFEHILNRREGVFAVGNDAKNRQWHFWLWGLTR